MRDNYEFVLQENTFDCGVAALKTIFLQFERHIKTEDIVTKKINQGLTALDLIEASSKLGIEAKGVKTTLQNLDFNYLPCIAHVIKDKNYYHYIVILKNNKRKNNLIVMDPTIGITTLTYKDFNNITTNIFIIFNKDKIEKENDKRFINLLKNICFKNKKTIIYIIISSLITIMMSLVFNTYLTLILKYNLSYKYIALISFIYLLICIIKTYIQFIRDQLITKLNKKIDSNINNQIVKHIINLPYKYYCNKTVGELITIITDIENIKTIVTKLFVLLFVDIILLLFLLVFISFYNFYYLLIFILLIIFSIFTSHFYQNIFNKKFIIYKKTKESFNSYLVSAFSAFVSIKNLRLENKIISQAGKKYQELLNNSYYYDKSNNYYKFINNLILEMFYIIVIAIGFIIGLKNNLSVFNIIFFGNLFYIFIGILNNVNENIVVYKVFKSSIYKVLDILELLVEDDSNKYLKFDKIVLDNVTFKQDEKKILDNINLEIRKKDKILIYGKSGIGKTTLIKVLLKYFELNKGNIYFDTINQKYLDSKTLRNSITYVSQEEVIFKDTVYNNLALINHSSKVIEQVMQRCLISLDKNYLLEENGTNISGGERKKILIARSLLKNSNMIIFDESFNELDQNSERIILENIINDYKNLTIIIISHQRNNFDLFNKCFELKNGKLVKEE